MNINLPEMEKENPFANNPNLLPVPVVATFNKEGKMIPLYFAVEGIRIKVDHVRWTKSMPLLGELFGCEVTVTDAVQQVELCWHKNYNIWTLKRDSIKNA